MMTALRELNASNQKDEVRNKMRAGVFLVSRMLRDQVFAVSRDLIGWRACNFEFDWSVGSKYAI